MVEARVEYDYDAENVDELTLRIGDIITNVVQKEGGWWEGRLKGKQGVFPDNFVKVLSKEHKNENKSNGISLRQDKKRKCRVVYSYTPVNDDELELEVDTVIDVLEEVEEGWWKGNLNGRVGVFPSNFVEELNNDRTGNVANIPNARSSKEISDNTEIKPKPVRGIGLGNIFQDEVIRLKSTQDSSPERKTSPSPIPKKPTYPSSSTDAPVLPPKPVREQARVLFAYDACNDDELTLKEGDVITILTKEVEDKGWWKGELNNRVGVFPDNFVEIVQQPELKIPKKVDRPHLPVTEAGEKISDAPPPIPDHPKRPLPDVNKKDDTKPSRPEKPAPPTPGKKPQLPPPMKKPQRFPTPSNSIADQMTDDMKDELDSVESTADKLTHLTATRPRNPYHRPPSHLFLKDTDVLGGSERENKQTTSPVKGEQVQSQPPKGKEQVTQDKMAAASPPTKPAMKSMATGFVDADGMNSPPPRLKHYTFSSKSALMATPKEKEDVVSKMAKLNPDDSACTLSEMKKEIQSLKNKVLELQLMMETHRAQYQDKIRELTLEIDEEKKTRLLMHVELDRLKRQLRDH